MIRAFRRFCTAAGSRWPWPAAEGPRTPGGRPVAGDHWSGAWTWPAAWMGRLPVRDCSVESASRQTEPVSEVCGCWVWPEPIPSPVFADDDCEPVSGDELERSWTIWVQRILTMHVLDGPTAGGDQY